MGDLPATTPSSTFSWTPSLASEKYIIEAEGYDGMEYNPSGPLHLVR